MKWTDLERSIVLQGIADGLTGSQIAVQLPGRTRNAVIGYIDRQGLTLMRSPTGQGKRQPRVKPSRPRAKPTGNVVRLERPTPAAKPAKVIVMPEDEYNADALRLTIMDLRANQCRWPVNDAHGDEEHLFCGKQTSPNGLYCAHHRAVAYRGLGKLEKAAEYG